MRGSSSRSEADPERAIRPTASTTPRSDTASASAAFCSTTRTVMPKRGNSKDPTPPDALELSPSASSRGELGLDGDVCLLGRDVVGPFEG